MNALYDTNIVIDFLKHIPAARQELDHNPTKDISIISWIEVMAGTVQDEEEETRTVLSTFHAFPLTSSIAERAYAIRRNRRLKLPDALILATAQVHARILVTRNTRDFAATDTDVRIPYIV